MERKYLSKWYDPEIEADTESIRIPDPEQQKNEAGIKALFLEVSKSETSSDYGISGSC